MRGLIMRASTTTVPAVLATALLFLLAALPRAGLAGGSEFSLFPTSGGAWNFEETYVYTSLYTTHFDPEPEHNNHQKMLGVELLMQNNWSFGLASFDNSFDQRSQYLYAGYRWTVPGHPAWSFKLSGGLLHGYEDEYQDKIPYNNLGTAPAIVPALGYRHGGFIFELNLAGLAAATVTAGYAF